MRVYLDNLCYSHKSHEDIRLRHKSMIIIYGFVLFLLLFAFVWLLKIEAHIDYINYVEGREMSFLLIVFGGRFIRCIPSFLLYVDKLHEDDEKAESLYRRVAFLNKLTVFSLTLIFLYLGVLAIYSM